VAFRTAALAPNPRGGAWPGILVKRVIGLPGDRVSMRNGSPVINGWPVPWCDAGEYMNMLSTPGERGVHGRLRVEFLDDRAYLAVLTPSPAFEEPYEVRPGEVFVLGDNRGNSSDSRAFGAHGGGVPLAALDAKVQWFFAGTHRSGKLDLGRVFSGIDALEKRIRLEGVGVDALEVGIAKCLASRPAETHPPATPPASAAARIPLDFGKLILGIGESVEGPPGSLPSDPVLFLANTGNLRPRDDDTSRVVRSLKNAP
jgi:signal peptidase I